LSVLATEPTGRSPVETFWTPDRRYAFVTHTNDTFVSVFDARTYREVARLEVGRGSANIGFTRDGATAFISIRGRNAVAVVDVSRLEVVSEIPVGTEPQGLIVL
jgi:DNA-binding beta-propeller fold protein YncE